MLDAFSALTAPSPMLPPGATVLCAVSGGADSMCLLHLLSRREDLTLHAAHFNHRLRGEESDRDEQFVRTWCSAQGIPFHSGGGDVAGEARRRKLGIEETARAMRYDFLSRLCLELGADAIATAHNADDNVETVLLHLLRGSGLQGLGGMAPVRQKYVRPLLTVPRRDIEAYLQEHHIPHVEDSTNAQDAFLRNRVRHQLIPLLEAWNPGFSRRMTQAIPRLRADNEALEQLARDLSRRAERRGEGLAISASLLADAPEPIALRAVRLLMGAVNGGNEDVSSPHLTSVLALARSPDPSARVSLPRGLTARREYDRLVLSRDERPPALEPFSPLKGENPIPGTDWALMLKTDPWPGLVVRPRRQGDAITLPGRPAKTLKDLLIDRKVPRWEREGIPVCADGDGVLALAGFGENTAHPRSGQVQFIKIIKKEENGQ